MTLGGEVLHVVQKDVRQARLMLASYGALALLAAVSAASGAGSDLADAASGLVPFALLVFGPLLVAAAVQEDSPVRPTAFWATRPLRPAAVAGGKLVLALLLLLTAVAAQVLALLWLRVSWGESVSLTLVPALRLGAALLIAAFLAGATRSLGQFAAAGLLLAVGSLMLTGEVENYLVVPHWSRLLVPLLLFGGVLIVQYRRRALLAVTAVGVVVVLLGAFVRSPRQPLFFPLSGPPAAMPPTAGADHATLRRMERPGDASQPARYLLQLPAAGLPRAALLRSAALVVPGADGARDTIARYRSRRLVGEAFSGGGALPFEVDAGGVARLEGAAGLAVELELAGLSPSPYGSVAARRGSRAGGAYPLKVTGAAVQEDRARLTLSTAGLNELDANVRRVEYGHGFSSHEFTLVDRSTRTTVPLRVVSGSSVSRTLVLPGSNLLRETLVLESAQAVDAGQLQRSRVVVTHWAPGPAASVVVPVTLE